MSSFGTDGGDFFSDFFIQKRGVYSVVSNYDDKNIHDAYANMPNFVGTGVAREKCSHSAIAGNARSYRDNLHYLFSQGLA